MVYVCTQTACGVLRDRSHYHCPTCDKAFISRGDFAFHLKGHEAKQGVKPSRGRRKTLASVMGDTAGLQNIQVQILPTHGHACYFVQVVIKPV